MRLPTRPIKPRHRPSSRLAIGITFSLVLHGLILSLQFGELGLALPGVELPWAERRAQTPELTVTLANALPKPGPPISTAVDSTPLPPVPLQPPVPESAKAEPSVSRPKPPVSGLVLQAPQAAIVATPVPTPAKLVSKNPKPKRKTVVASKPKSTPKQAETAQAEVRPPIIAKAKTNDDPFVVDTPSPEDLQPPTSPKAMTTEPAPEPSPSTEPVPPIASRDEPVLAKHDAEAEKEREAEKEQQARETQAAEQAKKAEQEAQAKIAQADTEKRDEAARQQAAAIAVQNEKLLAQKREQDARENDDANRRAMELEAKQREEIKKQLEAKQREETRQQLEAKAARESMELAAQKQAEIKRAQEADAIRLKREQEAAAIASAEAEANHRKAVADAEATANRKKAEADAAADAQRKEQARIAGERSAAAANAATARGNETRPFAPGSLAANPGGGDLASRALSQARKLDLFSPTPLVSKSASSGNESSRRRSIFGSKNKELGLRMYIDNWRLKIERNGRLNYAQSSIEKVRGDPVVTVAVRSDGSVEDIIINRSSGRSDVDEAVRRIVKLNARYSAFPPALASQYDVIEIHHVWNFDETLRLLDEVQ